MIMFRDEKYKQQGLYQSTILIIINKSNGIITNAYNIEIKDDSIKPQ